MPQLERRAVMRRLEAESLVAAYVAERMQRLIAQERGGSRLRRLFLDDTMTTASRVAIQATEGHA